MVHRSDPSPQAMVGVVLDGSTLVAVWHVEFRAQGMEPGSFHQFLMKREGRPYTIIMVDRGGDLAVSTFARGEPTSDEDAFTRVHDDHQKRAPFYERHRVVCLRVGSADPAVIRSKVAGFMGLVATAPGECPCAKCSPRGAA